MNVLVALGTRPEAIKLWCVITELRKAGAIVSVVNTRQSPDLVDTILEELGIGAFAVRARGGGVLLTPDHGIYAADSASLPFLSEAIAGLSMVLSSTKRRTDLVVVQGDTTTALAGALAAFYAGIPIAHVEAGLRTYDLTSPYPEEGNRQMISRIATLHFCPTLENSYNVGDERCTTEHGYVVGNTGIDALGMVAKMAAPGALDVLVTFHRREGWSEVEALAQQVKVIAKGRTVRWITHGNPALRGRVRDCAGTFNASSEPCDNNDGPCQCGAWHKPAEGIVLLSDPLGYKDFIRELCSARVVITDSGGVVEECVSLGRRCIMVRDATERAEALENGNRLVGFDDLEQLPQIVSSALENWTTPPSNVFGDGRASERIASHIVDFLKARHGK